jgi:hypothetical protein
LSAGQPAPGGLLGPALATSIVLHAALMLSLGGGLRLPSPAPRAEPLMAVLSLAAERAELVSPEPDAVAAANVTDIANVAKQPPAQAEAARAVAQQGILFDPRRYYRSDEVDVRARPLSMATQPRSERVVVLEPEGAASQALPDDVKELRFHPAQRGGVAVPSRKRVELSFVP